MDTYSSREDLKKKRLKILNEIDKLMNLCECEVLEEKVNCNNCKKIAELGCKLDNLLSERVIVASDHELKEPEARKDMSIYYAEKLLDIDTYIKNKSKSKGDKEAAAMCGISYTQLRKWKTVMGLTKEKRK